MDIYLQHFNGEAIIATFLCEKLKKKNQTGFRTEKDIKMGISYMLRIH